MFTVLHVVKKGMARLDDSFNIIILVGRGFVFSNNKNVYSFYIFKKGG